MFGAATVSYPYAHLCNSLITRVICHSMIIIEFLPIIFFIGIYVGSGIYFSCLGVDNAFYQTPSIVAILPAIAIAWFLYKGTKQEKLEGFIKGASHSDIMTMCIIFLLSGAFTQVTNSIGGVTAIVNLTLSLISEKFLLVGIFATSAIIATSIGTSMGTIATMAPIAFGLAQGGAVSKEIAMATVVGGSMFGDNLSLVSDTTVASVACMGADMKKKFKLNFKIALIAAVITVLFLLFQSSGEYFLEKKEYKFFLIVPYILLLLISILGTNVLVGLFLSIISALYIGYVDQGYSFSLFNKDIVKGFLGMSEIMILSILSGGLSGLLKGGIVKITERIASIKLKSEHGHVFGQLLIAGLVSLFDIIFANNTIAIIFAGNIAPQISQKYKIAKEVAASWLDIFSCVFQGIIPWGAQILLVSSIAGISPLAMIGKVYYCYILAIISLAYIFFKKRNN